MLLYTFYPTIEKCYKNVMCSNWKQLQIFKMAKFESRNEYSYDPLSGGAGVSCCPPENHIYKYI